MGIFDYYVITQIAFHINLLSITRMVNHINEQLSEANLLLDSAYLFASYLVYIYSRHLEKSMIILGAIFGSDLDFV